MRALVLAVTLFSAVSCVTSEPRTADQLLPEGRQLGAVPRRPAGALGGAAFLRSLAGLSGETRETAILNEVRRGNIPDRLRILRPVRIKGKDGAKPVEATVYVMPDYLAVGSNDDFAYVPMTPVTAQRIADHFGFLLPTRKLVDAVYDQAELKLPPQPMKPGPAMTRTEAFERHNAAIRAQIGARKMQGLTVGHKKDIVLTNRHCDLKRRVAIYGWHKTDGKPIQPLSLVHGDDYADYSHGVRLVANTLLLDGVEKPVAEVLQNPRLASLLSDEGYLKQVRIATDCSDC